MQGKQRRSHVAKWWSRNKQLEGMWVRERGEKEGKIEGIQFYDMTEMLEQTRIVSLHAAHVPVLQLPDFFLSEFHFQIPWCSVCSYGQKMLGISLKMIPLVPMMCHTGLSWERRDGVVSLPIRWKVMYEVWIPLGQSSQKTWHLFIRKSQADVSALTTLMEKELPQEENVIGKRSISIIALGRGCRYGTERLRIVQTGLIRRVQEETAFANEILSL